jgi:hypothetical protein
MMNVFGALLEKVLSKHHLDKFIKIYLFNKIFI